MITKPYASSISYKPFTYSVIWLCYKVYTNHTTYYYKFCVEVVPLGNCNKTIVSVDRLFSPNLFENAQDKVQFLSRYMNDLLVQIESSITFLRLSGEKIYGFDKE